MTNPNANGATMIQEVAEFNRKLAVGLKNLSELDEISTGVSTREAVFRDDKVTLYRYATPAGVKRSKVPTLVVYALVNRPYMTDLQEDRSMIRGLLEAGQDVYLIDWGYPDAADRWITLDDYINGYIDSCVDHILKAHGRKDMNLLGICQGGTLSLCYSALHPRKVRNLVTMVTPVDFQTPDNLLSRWSQCLNVDLLVDTLGNIPGDLMNATFLSMQPFRMAGQKYIDAVDLMQEPDKLKNFMRMEKWIFDSPDQAGEAFRQFIRDLYQRNLLIKGELKIGARTVDLGAVDMPVFNVYAEKDHLVPPAASLALRKHVGTKDYRELAFRGGHIGIFVSGGAMAQVPPAIGEWLDKRG